MKSKEEMREFAPWQKEEKSKKERVYKGSIPPQSRQRSQLHSKTKTKDHDHLEMYILSREKERLEKYGQTLGRRLRSIAATWKEVKSIMYHMQRNNILSREEIEELEKNKKGKETNKKKDSGNMKKKEWGY